MYRVTVVMALAVCGGTVRPAAQAIAYDVRFPNAIHHEAEITLRLTGLPSGPVALAMSRSSPGRYALHEFAKHVRSLRVEDGQGRVLPLSHPDPHQWDVVDHDGTVVVTYSLYGDRADGTYTQIDATHAHLNMPATFLWARHLDTLPIRVTFHPPGGSRWKVATQLFPTDQPFTFTAPGLQYFMDSPTELSDFTLREWSEVHGGAPLKIRLAIHHGGTEAEVDRFVASIRAIVAQEIAVFGEPPAFDVGTYTFIADYLPWASGDGMEHRNSTILSSSSSLAEAAPDLIGTVAHEFFHAWNVERIRPRSLEPFDFERANMSDALWLAEGFTSYYDALIRVRAGVTRLQDLASELGETITAVVLSPGRHFHSAAEMSELAPFHDGAAAVEPTDRVNTFLSYYTWGAAIGLGLDLTLRDRYGKTLDDLMRLLWQRHGRPERPYTLADVQQALADVTGDAAFAAEFFARYARGHEVMDYEQLLGAVGLRLRPSRPGAAFLGLVDLEFGETGATIGSPTRVGSPLYAAGLDRGDVITAIGGRALRGDGDWQAIKAAHRPGDTVTVAFVSRGTARTSALVLASDPRLEVDAAGAAGQPLSARQQRLRDGWLAPR